MRYFLVEGRFNNPIPIGGTKLDGLVKEHLSKLNKEVEKGNILFTASKKDNSGIIFLMKSVERNDIDIFISKDPLYSKDVQKYVIKELSFKDIGEKISEWIE